MSKKILFMSSAKLTAISVGLLLAVFCTISMSFRPVYSEDEKELVMSGPRYNHWHWTTGSCTTTHHYKSSVDYALTKVQTRGNGSVTISTTEVTNVTAPSSGNPRTASSGTTAGNEASVSWNSGLSHGDQTSAQYTDAQITAAHKKTFTISANPISDDYYFAGWGTSTNESSIDNYDNPRVITSDMGITTYTNSGSEPDNYKNANSPYTETYYAFFKQRVPANITLKVPMNGTVTYSYETNPAATLASETVVTTKYDLALVATPDAGYVFFGWYTMDGSTEDFISTSESYTRAYPNDITIYAKFIPAAQAIFNIKGTEQYYYDLGRACSDAASSSSKIVYPIQDGVVPAGNYTVPSGVTLLVPYNSANNKQTTPTVITYNASGLTVDLSIYRKLILCDGANITVASGGYICVGGQMISYNGGNPSAYPIGACGVIDMSAGGHIELNGTIYCWGFIKGQDMDQGNNTQNVGTITANAGAVIWEDFAVGDWRGGTACSTIASHSSSWKFFPFQSYTIQNIEVPTTYKYNSTLSNFTNVYGNSKQNAGTFSLIGKTNTLFQLTNASSSVRKWYDPTTDLVNYEMSGSAQLDALNVDVGITTVSSGSYNLPLSSNMKIVLASGCNMTLSKPMVVQPGAVVEIENGASLTCSSNVYLFDRDNWGLYCNGRYYYTMNILSSHKNRGTGKAMTYQTDDEKTKYYLDDAKIVVDGTLNVTGKMYTTAGGADIMGNGGGNISFSSLGGSGNIVMCTGVSTNEDVAIAQANMHNEDESYTKSIASTTFHNVNGRWFAASAKDEKANHTYDFTYISSGAVSGTDGTTSTVDALYAPDKTGLVAGMKWCNVEQDATCSNIYNATQALNETPASDIRYTYPSSSWLQLLRTETEGVYGGSDNSLYAVDGCAVNSLGSVDENCLYTIGDVKKALVDGHFVALEKNTEDEAWHDVANPTNYYICFEGCNWHPATKYAGEEKAYIVEEGDYIWYNNDWLLVEREDPFFFDYNDQNVKRYYEYEDGAWVLASPRVRVVDAIETRDFYTMPEAITVASGKKNTTITILKDISGINTRMTYTAKNTTCTLDLNGHTVSGAAPFGDDNNRGLLIINASGTTFTITDNSANKEGRLENICNQNKVTYTVHLMAGTLNVEHGTIHAENPAQYHSSNLASCGARGIHVAATNTLNVSGGRVEAKATRVAYAIVEASSAANNTTVNITGGEIYAEAPYAAYGVLAYGKLNVSGANTITAKINTDMVDAAYAADHANNKKNAEGRGIYMHVSANKAKGSCYYGTLTYTGGTINVTNERSNNADLRNYGIYFYCDNATTDNRGGATDGSSGQKAAAKGSVKNANITVTSGTQYSVGIYVMGSYNSYDKSTHVVKIENCNIDVKGYANNFGIWANAGVNGTNGGCYHGDVQADNCTVHVESTGSSNAYGAWASATATTIAHYKNPTTEAAGTEASKYYGEYASAAKLTINGGSYTAKTKSAGAYAVGTTAPRAISPYGSKYSDAAFRTEGGHAKDSATLIINGGTFNATSTTYTARGLSSGGITTVDNATFNVVAGSYNAFGLYASSGKLTATNVQVNDTAKSRVSSSDSNGYAYGAFADCAIPTGNTAQNGFGYAGEIELNNCTLNVATTTYPTARGLMVNATSKLHNWTTFHADSLSNKWTTANYNYYKQVFPCTIQGKDSVWIGVAGKVTTNGGTINVKAATTSAWGGYVSRALHYSYHTPNTILEQCPGVLNINGTSFDVSTGTSTTAEGVRTYGIVNISGDSYFNVHPATTTAIGLRIYAGTTTVNDNSTFDITAGSSTAYGALLGDTPADKTGALYNGELVVNGGTFNVEATTKTAYGVYVQALARQITSTAAGYYPGTYASIGHATINNGTFNVTAGTTTAMGVYVGRAVTADNLQIFRGVADINGGTFNVTTSTNDGKANQCDGILTYGTTTIKGGSFDVLCKNDATPANGVYAYGVYVLDGTTTINKNIDDETKPSFNVKAYGTVYSVLVSADVANATTGLTYNGNVIIDGGTYSDTTTTGNSAYGVCVSMPAPRVIASGDHAGTYYSTATATINDGTFNVYSTGTTGVGVFTGRTYISANTKPNTFSNWKEGNTTINGGTFNTSATTTAVGVYTDGEAIVNGGDFYPTGRTSDAYGIYARAGRTTVNKTNNPSFTVKAPTIVYGALVGGQPANKTGLPYDGELIVNGGDFDVQTTSGATAYGVFVNADKRKITSTSSGYYQGQYASAGTATINDGTFYVKAVGKTASGINMVATASYAAGAAPYEAVSATPTCTVTGGKFKVFASSSASAVVSTPLAENMPISGGYYNINTNLAKYAVSPKKVLTLRESHSLYPDYKYTINEGGTVTWKNGSTSLLTEVYESGETPEYTGATPTKTETAEYTYSHSGWDPTIEAMANADQTYTATFNHIEKKYTVSVAAGANGSASPASVSNIGCETASGDITATPNVGYSFSCWTLPEGVTLAEGYELTSNPVRIHATAADKTITANFVPRTDINYTVKHWQQNLDNNEYTEYESEGKKGTTATPTAAAAKSYTGFTAQSFEQGTIAGNGSTIVNIYYNRNTFTITWLDGNGNAVETDENVKYGATPEYNGATPIKTATAQYTYTFNNTWSPAIVAVTEDATYTAQFGSTVNDYTITWVDGNGATLKTEQVEYGQTPAYTGETPTKTATAQYTYTFNNTWSPAITPVTGDATYTAQFGSTVNDYTITWVDGNGETLKTEQVAYGQTPAYTGATPTKTATAQYTYTFNNTWSPAIVAVTGEATYTAQFGSTVNKYTITWVDGNGETLKTEQVAYGQTPAYTGATPTKTATAQYTYTFNNTWSPAIVAVTGAATYTAQFGSTVNEYTITWVDGNGETLKTEQVAYGQTPAYTGSTPTKTADAQYTYTFNNTWTPAITAVTANATYTAQFDQTHRPYTITWLNCNGALLCNTTSYWNETPAYPTHEYNKLNYTDDDKHLYRFIGWDPKIHEVNNDVNVYTAQYERIDNLVVATEESINMNTTVTTTTVRVEGKLDVTSGSLTTEDLILEGTPSSSGEIMGAVTATRALFHFTQPGGFKARTWYAVAVPWEVEVPAGRLGGVYLKKGEGDYVQQRLGKTYDLIYYDGYRRSQGENKAWNYVEDDAAAKQIMYPGRAYMIYLTSDADTIRFERKENAKLHTNSLQAHTYESPIDVAYANWNGIANPATYHAYLNVGATDGRGQVYNPDTKQYELFDMSAKQLVVGQPIFVQSAVDGTVVASSTTYSPSMAPRRSKAWTAPFTRYELMLAADDADVTDRVIVRMDEDKEEDSYTVGQDLAKMGVSSVVPQMWIDRYDSKMCINTVAGFNHTADYPLGIFAPKDGEYNLFMDDQPNDETMLYLTYDGEAIWNLSYGGYVTYLTKGTDTHYGLRIVAHKPQTPTGIEETTIQNGDPIRKVMVDGKVYIIRNGEIYSVTGQKTK